MKILLGVLAAFFLISSQQSSSYAADQSAPIIPGGNNLAIRNCTPFDLEVVFSRPYDSSGSTVTIPKHRESIIGYCPPSCQISIETPGEPKFLIQALPQKRYLIRGDRSTRRWIIEPLTVGSTPPC